MGQVTKAADHVPHILAAGHCNGAFPCVSLILLLTPQSSLEEIVLEIAGTSAMS